MRTETARQAHTAEMLGKHGTLLTLSRVRTDKFHCAARRKGLKFVETELYNYKYSYINSTGVAPDSSLGATQLQSVSSGKSRDNIVTCLGVCITCRWVMDWWPDLLHTYTTYCYTSQTTVWHIISSLLNIFDWLFSTELFFITTLNGPTRKRRFQQYPYCVFTDALLRNGFFCCVRAHFRGNLFTEPLLSNELFQLSGIVTIFEPFKHGGYYIYHLL
jgi:hypothetical protein